MDLISKIEKLKHILDDIKRIEEDFDETLGNDLINEEKKGDLSYLVNNFVLEEIEKNNLLPKNKMIDFNKIIPSKDTKYFIKEIEKKINEYQLIIDIQNKSKKEYKEQLFKTYASTINKHILSDTLHKNHGVIFNTKNSLDLIKIMKKVEQFSKTQFNILITGERGTGKEIIAKAIETAWKTQNNSSKDMVTFNAAGANGDIVNSELFGHVKGAFSDAITDKKGLFEQANGGILFLDEIGALPLDTQAKILRAVEYGKIHRVGSESEIAINVKVIAATNENLSPDRFRADLKDRLSEHHISIPPLRKHIMDVPLLAIHFANQMGGRLTSKEIRSLMDDFYPGNIRELKNKVMNILVLNDRFQNTYNTFGQIIAKFGGNKSRVSQMLQIKYSTLLDWHRKEEAGDELTQKAKEKLHEFNGKIR